MRFKKFIKIEILTVIILLTMSAAGSLSAASLLKPGVGTNIDNSAKTVGGAAGYNESTTATDALYLVQTVINIFLSVIGVLLLVYILYGGYNWLTAQGEEEKVTKAKDTIKRAIVGMIIIVAAYAISTFVMSRIETNTLKGGGGGVGGYTPTP